MPPQDWECYLAKAQESLRSAHSAEGRGLTNCAANRSYYAAYLAELAAIVKFTNVTLPATGWQHPIVVKAFNHRLVTGRKFFDAQIIADVAFLESLRIKADYKVESVTVQEARDCFKIARKVVLTIEKKLRE